jgi:DNA-binding CsgD family transcriptional regulator
MSGIEPPAGLYGRSTECAALDQLLDKSRGGTSAILVLRGEPGIGKTALLDYAASRATDFRVLRAGGVELEMELPYAALHQLFLPLLREAGKLPAPQRIALEVAFGLQQGQAPDRFLVGLAALGLMAHAAQERPLLCLIDDAQWLDQASFQALTLAARRLLAEPVAMIFTVRDSYTGHALGGLPELAITGLADVDARKVLTSATHGRLDPQVRDRIIAETHGNPLALLQLPRGLSPVELAGGFWLPAWRSVANQIEDSFQRQLRSLPDATRQFLLVAAADPVGDAALLWRAAALQGISPDAAGPAEAAGLAEFGVAVRFRHPLVRSAIYRDASGSERRAAHQALAEGTDPDADPDRRAWHRAHAASGPDEEAAAELERSAGRAQDRGGAAAAAAFLEMAAELTPDPARRAARALAAAQAKFDVGGAEEAYRLLAIAENGPLTDLQRANLELLQARLVFSLARGSGAAPLFLSSARRLAPLDAALARDAYLEALGAAIFAGRLGGDAGVREAAEAASSAPPLRQSPRDVDVLLDGLVTRFTEGYDAAAVPLRRAVQVFHKWQEGWTDDVGWRWLWLVCPVMPEPLAAELWDDEALHELAAGGVRLARSAGALAVLPLALCYRASAHVLAGEFRAASALIDEAGAISQATGNPPLRYTSVLLLAWRGHETEAMDVIEATVKDATTCGEGRALGLAEYATALLYNGLGRYDAALTAAQRACEYEDLGIYSAAMIELIEAAARSDRADVADTALRTLAGRTRVAGTEWALGMETRSRALLADDATAEAMYLEAIQRLDRTRVVGHAIRARLLYGEWLRRQGRRQDAREMLRTAYETFARIGADAFAERARRELLAAGEAVAREGTVATLAALTPQEAQIARMAKDGQSNPEIAAELFISPRTVEWHLRNVFMKLGITSRKDLRSSSAFRSYRQLGE